MADFGNNISNILFGDKTPSVNFQSTNAFIAEKPAKENELSNKNLPGGLWTHPEVC